MVSLIELSFSSKCKGLKKDELNVIKMESDHQTISRPKLDFYLWICSGHYRTLIGT
jgi:hypothetical protein